MLRHSPPPQKSKKRLGAAAVELAIVLPVFMSLAFVSIETGHALKVSQALESAIRDGGRLATKDVDPSLLAGGITANQKVINDIKNMLRAEGYSTTNVAVSIVYADGPTVGQTFDLSLTSNQYKLMKITVSIPYSDVRMFPMSISQSSVLKSTLIASKGRASLNY